jgi:hypothetical protein
MSASMNKPEHHLDEILLLTRERPDIAIANG